jgi:hypothetical protein
LGLHKRREHENTFYPNFTYLFLRREFYFAAFKKKGLKTGPEYYDDGPGFWAVFILPSPLRGAFVL